MSLHHKLSKKKVLIIVEFPFKPCFWGKSCCYDLKHLDQSESKILKTTISHEQVKVWGWVQLSFVRYTQACQKSHRMNDDSAQL